jgi:cyclopropane-fatty-acyl-phospholipid synthase
MGDPPLDVRLWNGDVVHSGTSCADGFSLLIRDRRTLWGLLSNPWVAFGDAYSRSRLEIVGDIADMLCSVYRCRAAISPYVAGIDRWLSMLQRNTPSRSRENVWQHYDIGNAFFKLWLDEQLVYTCAYYPRPDMTLEQAQVAKMDHICRKLELRPGQHVLEAGCGWGAFALHMARHYGVNVKAYNVSREQIAFARQRCRDEKLESLVEFIEDDWRSMDSPCDAFVSVGMLEHVGLHNYRTLGGVINRCLKPDGRALLHTIGQNRPVPVNPWIQRRVFPGAYPPTLRQMMRIIEPHGFSVLDAENLRLHYAQTLRHWLDRFEEHVSDVRAMFDEQFVRMWRLYLCGSLAAFDAGDLQLFQVLFCRGTSNNVPRSRAAVYEPEL